MVEPQVRLLPVDEEALHALARLARNEAEPNEVTPPLGEEPGWNRERLDWFRAFHRTARAGLVLAGSASNNISGSNSSGANTTATWAVSSADGLLGSARLALSEATSATGPALEAGLWLRRSARGKGIGAAVLRLLIAEAASLGAVCLVAETRAQNLAARAVLARLGGVETVVGDSVQVRFEPLG